MPGSGLPDFRRANAELTRVSSGERAAHRIRQMIFDRTLEPGTRIAQDEIAESFGISRIPLREALIALEREGWVELKLHRGAFVNTFDEASLVDHYDILGAVYAFAATAALERTPDHEAFLRDLRSIQARLDDEPEPTAAGQVLRQFHLRIIEAARSTRTEALLRAIPSLIPGDIFSVLPHVVDLERAAIPHLVRAFEERDRAAVAQVYRTMMRAVGHEVAALFRERQLFGEEPSNGDEPSTPPERSALGSR